MKGLLFHSEVFFTLFFWYEVEFLLSCWLRQCWSIWHVNILYCSFLFRKDWLILNQTKCSFTNKIFDQQMCTQAKYMSLTVSIKLINGKIWVFTPLCFIFSVKKYDMTSDCLQQFTLSSDRNQNEKTRQSFVVQEVVWGLRKECIEHETL